MSKKNRIPKLPGDFVKVLKPIVDYGEISGCLVEKMFIKKVIYNNPVTVVLWSDDTKTISKCGPNDDYNKETGLLWCIMKKLCKNSAIKDTMKYWCPYTSSDSATVTLSSVRKQIKAEMNQ